MNQTSDLSQHHHLISDLFPDLSAEEIWSRYRLSHEQIDFFHENGYLSHIKILEENQIEQLRKELEKLSDSDHPGHDLFYEYH